MLTISRLATLTCLGLILFACRDAPDKKTPPPAKPPEVVAAAQSASTGVTDAEVVLGQPAAFSGPSAGLGIEMWRGASAAFSTANDAGGVQGRKIRLVVRDDAYDAEKAAQAVVKLIEEDRVFAIFGGVGTPTIVRALPVVRKYFGESGLFYFSNFTGAQPQRRPPYSEVVFNVRASYYQETKAMVDAYVAAGKKHIGVFVQDDAYGTDGREGVERALKDHGLSLAADTRYPRGQLFDVSTATQLKILRDAGTDAIVMVGSYQPCAAFIRDTRASGWTVPIDSVSFVGANQMLDLLLAEQKKTGTPMVVNLITTQVVPHYDDVKLALVRDYRAAIDKYKPTSPSSTGDGAYKPPSPYTFGSLEGFVSARAFLAVLDKTGKDLTRRTFYAAAEHMGSFDLGLGVPAELSAERHQVLDKVWFTVAGAEGWKPVDSPAAVLK